MAAETPEPIAGLFIRDDDEGLFSRDIDGQLVRLDAPTEDDYQKQVTLEIDGQKVTVPMAEPLTDANGNVVVDLDGRTTPRYTTIYDAARKLYVKQSGDEAKIPIPTLCHQSHMQPVAVCRLCVVQIYGQKRGKRAAERKLLPACQHQVKPGMEVFTMNATGPDGDRVRDTVRVMTEFLAADHLKPAPIAELAPDLAHFNELGQMAERCGANPERFRHEALTTPVISSPTGRRVFDASSPVFVVDHSACILCERCIRACDEVKGNNVIGRTGKGATAGVGFDLNDLMGQSGCVQCGECMVSCPTTAITFKPVAKIKLPKQDDSSKPIPAKELIDDPIFAGMPPKFLLWQDGLVIRKNVKKGQMLCYQGDAGNTAFLIKRGALSVEVFGSPQDARKGLTRRKPMMQFTLGPDDLIVGEMACLSGSPRSANVVASESGEVWEVRRNVLDRMMRLPSQHARFIKAYRERSLNLVLKEVELFAGLSKEEQANIVNFLRQKIQFVSVKANQILFRQGDDADAMYLVRLGHVRIAIERFGQEAKVLSAGPGSIVGEIGLIAFSESDIYQTLAQADAKLAARLAGSEPFPVGQRTATCSALGALEMARIGRADFLNLVREHPEFRSRLVEQTLARLRSNTLGHALVHEFVEAGLYEGQSILVLDTELCTRCDECTKACVDQHGTESHGIPMTRLLRDGVKLSSFVVATSCRSCLDPHCMFGCPVDAIHRGKHLQIVIEDHCIGCGLCAKNCPYGSIFMVPNENNRILTPDPTHPGKTLKVAQKKAAACDLCDSDGEKAAPEPRCVAACPHEAASRMTGDELLRRAIQRSDRRH